MVRMTSTTAAFAFGGMPSHQGRSSPLPPTMGDVSVFGIGMLEATSTVLRYSFRRSARVTVEQMLKRIERPGRTEKRSALISSDLVMGQSCSAARGD